MDLPVEIVVRGTMLTEEDDALIRRCAGRFPAFLEGILACRVAVQGLRRDRGGPPEYAAQIRLVLPAGDVAVAEPPSRDRFTAIQEALDAAGRQLHGYTSDHRRHPMQRYGSGAMARQTPAALAVAPA